MLQTLLLSGLLGLAGLCGGEDVPVRDTLAAVTFTAERSEGMTGAAPVMTASAESITRRGVKGLEEVLRTMPGLSVKDYGGIGGLKTVSVRGLGAEHTAVCYDGMAVSNAQNGYIDISRFNLENVSGLTVEIGPADDIFRPARTMSAGGVLSIASKAPDFSSRSTRVSAQMRYGSFSTYNPYLLLQRKISERWSADASADYLRSDGDYPFRLQNGQTVTTERRTGSEVSILNAEANLRGALLNGAAVSAKINFLTSRRGLPGPVILYARNPTETLYDRDFTAAASYENTHVNGLKLRANLGYALTWNRYIDANPFYSEPQDDRYLQQEWSASFIGQYRLNDRIRLVLAEDLLVNHLTSDIPYAVIPTRLTDITSFNGQYRDDRLTLTACLTATAYAERVQTGEPAPSRARLSPSLSISYRLAGSFRLRASYKDGFRVPTFNDLYYERIGNRNLVPETARQTGAGATWSVAAGRAAFSFTADGYFNDVRDKIIAVPTMFIWHMRNLGRVSMLGADLNATATLPLSDHTTARLNANYSYLSACDITDPEAKNYRHQIQYTPKHSGNILATLETRLFNLNYTLTAVGTRYYLPQNIPGNALDPYFDHSVSLNRSFKLRCGTLRASFEALNLAGSNYEVIHSYPMPGRNYRLTIKITLL